VKLVKKGFALICFKDVVSAFFAQLSLHDYQFTALGIKLNIKWVVNGSVPQGPPQQTFPLPMPYPQNQPQQSNLNFLFRGFIII
jgi:hypothetical protein